MREKRASPRKRLWFVEAGDAQTASAIFNVVQEEPEIRRTKDSLEDHMLYACTMRQLRFLLNSRDVPISFQILTCFERDLHVSYTSVIRFKRFEERYHRMRVNATLESLIKSGKVVRGDPDLRTLKKRMSLVRKFGSA